MYQDTTERTIVQHNKNQLTRTDKMSEWISVKDRLPEDGFPVLGWSMNTGVLVFVLNYDAPSDDGSPGWDVVTLVTGQGHPQAYGLEYDEELPTHWMPLPEPPSE